LARAKAIVGVVGTQAPFAPEIQYLKHLVAEGFVGDILSTTIVAWGGTLQGGGAIPDKKTYGYLLDRANGATMLTIPVGHTLAALTSVLGAVAAVSAVVATRRSTAHVLETGEILPVTAPDQVLVSGVLANDVPASLHFRGGEPRDGDGLFWEINGTEGDIRVSGRSGHTQMVQLSLRGVRGEENAFRPLAVPASHSTGWPKDIEPGNVARVYASMAHDLRNGTRATPSFDDAVALHRIIDAIERAAEGGERVLL
jgi:predicted dehydrogenase